ncbi:MAG TPA: trypsin-like peptidase domain-containing protein, partial [Pirellulales bacterium]|nr:trypsin-like peptidase domain-containing protein [Pirellulales bacterium]
KMQLSRKLTPITLADHEPKKGDSVLTFGAPRGFGGTVSNGIVSAIRRGSEVREISRLSTGRDPYVDALGYDLDAFWVQTTAPISPGNSGGPLVDMAGTVVGMNTWCRTDAQNINFAISARHVAELMRDARGLPRPFDELPKPRAGIAMGGRLNGAKTLSYWNAVAKAKATRRRDSARRPKHSGEIISIPTSALENYAKALRAIDTRDVEPVLLELVGVDAQNAKARAEQLWHNKWGVPTVGDVIAEEKITAAYERIRGDLSGVYGTKFPPIDE